MHIDILEQDLVTFSADGIINAANEGLHRGGGVCGAIFQAADAALLEEQCRSLAPCPTGDVRVTPASGSLHYKWIIHAVGPKKDSPNRAEVLTNCYRNILKAADENGMTSLALPALSTGIFGYPVDEAADVAIATLLMTPTNVEVVTMCFLPGSDSDKASYYRDALSKFRAE